jgi:hypothetical protein
MRWMGFLAMTGGSGGAKNAVSFSYPSWQTQV